MRDGEPEKKIEISEVDLHASSRKLKAKQIDGSNSPGIEDTAGLREPELIEMMLGRGNMLKALQAVEASGCGENSAAWNGGSGSGLGRVGNG